MQEVSLITIAIISYKRPALLKKALESIKQIIIPDNCRVRILVVDNDIGESAYETVHASRKDMPFDVEYALEKNRGIPHARNKVLEIAKSEDFIAFTDDDDMVETSWLNELYKAVNLYRANIVQGYVNYLFPEATPEWLKKLDVFSSPNLPGGAELDSAWTNNVLFSTRIYKDRNLRFNSKFLYTGGSDYHFFRCAKSAGAKIVMCREAVVNSPVDIKRTGYKWLIIRFLRTGTTLTFSDILIEGHGKTIKNIFKTIKDSLKYSFRLFSGVRKKHNHILHPLLVLCFISGRIIGFFSISPREYKN